MFNKAAALAVAVGLSCGACGQADNRPSTLSSVTIRVAAPLSGAQAPLGRDLVDAAKLELKRIGSRVGGLQIELRTVDDSAPEFARGGQDGPSAAEVVSEEADIAANDPKTIAWLGDWDSNSAAVALPQLNQYGVIAVSPGATAIPLTGHDLSFPGAPSKYFPAEETFGRSFARVVANDDQVAKAAIQSLKSRGIRRVFTADSGDTDGGSFSSAIARQAQLLGVTVVGHMTVTGNESGWLDLVNEVRTSGAEVLAWGSPVGNGAESVWSAVAASGARFEMLAGPGIFGPQVAQLANTGSRTSLFSPILPDREYGRDAVAASGRFLAAKGRRPLPGALTAAASIKVLVEAIALAQRTQGPQLGGDDLRAAVSAALHRLPEVQTVIGRLRFARNGDTRTRQIGEWAVDSGRLAFVKVSNQ